MLKKSVIKNYSTEKRLGPDSFNDKIYPLFKEVPPILLKLFK